MSWVRAAQPPPAAVAEETRHEEPEPAPVEAAARRTVKLAPKPRIELESKPPSGTREPDKQGAAVLLAGWVDDVLPLETRSPGHERLEIAVDPAGRLHVLAHEQDMRGLSVVAAWAVAHAELIARAFPDRWIDPTANPVLHVFTDRPASLADLHGSDLRLLYNDPDYHEFDAVVIGDRPVPPVKPSTLDRSQDSGVFTVENVYFRQDRDGQPRPDLSIQEVRQVMVIEGIQRPKDDRGTIGRTNFERKRVIGVAPVQRDGSFSIRVPANIPISFNTLDSLGRAIVIKRNWVSARPGGEFPKCTGCNGPRGMDSGNPNPIAATLPPTDLNVPESQRVDVSFGMGIEPIIAAKCVSCHGGGTPAGNLNLSLAKDVNEPLFSLAYQNIFEMDSFGSTPRSRNSKLINRLLGFEPFQGAGRHPDPNSADALTDDELKKFMNWIDLGAQYR
ncbi:hypothetical protein IIA29_03050 [candidate division KSB1 bacterium]|nr:hypothetical protein [candidate division KSB1 bacterium]